MKYTALLPRMSSQGELNDLMSQMLGELGNSHEYIFGGDNTFLPPNPVETGMLGADVELDPQSQLHVFRKILRPEVWETDIDAPLTRNDVNLKDGDFLLAVNGKPLGHKRQCG